MNDISVDTTIEKDSLPADLRHDYYEKHYECPNNNRRRIPGFLYLAIGSFSITIDFITSEDSVLVNQGFTAAGIVLILFGLYNIQASWTLQVNAHDAVKAASCVVGFPIGHVSTQLAWRGLRSRPTWRLALYSGEPEPARRGLVLVDAVDNTVVEHLTDTLCLTATGAQ